MSLNFISHGVDGKQEEDSRSRSLAEEILRLPIVIDLKYKLLYNNVKSEFDPRRPLNSYLLFNAVLSRINEMNGTGLKPTMSQRWESLSHEEKEAWKIAATQLRKDYNKEFSRTEKVCGNRGARIKTGVAPLEYATHVAPSSPSSSTGWSPIFFEGFSSRDSSVAPSEYSCSTGSNASNIAYTTRTNSQPPLLATERTPSSSVRDPQMQSEGTSSAAFPYSNSRGSSMDDACQGYPSSIRHESIGNASRYLSSSPTELHGVMIDPIETPSASLTGQRGIDVSPPNSFNDTSPEMPQTPYDEIQEDISIPSWLEKELASSSLDIPQAVISNFLRKHNITEISVDATPLPPYTPCLPRCHWWLANNYPMSRLANMAF